MRASQISVFFTPIAVAYRSPFTRIEVRRILAAMMAPARIRGNGGLELTLTDDRGIAAVNEEFLGCKGPTNIITFPGDTYWPGAFYLSLDCLDRETLFYRQNRERHFIRLLAHGAGHLAGLDHGPEMSEIEHHCLIAGLIAGGLLNDTGSH